MKFGRSKKLKTNEAGYPAHPDAVAGRNAVSAKPPNYSVDAVDRQQAKSTLSRPDDLHEQEADRVADKVMRMTDGEVVSRVMDPQESKSVGRASGQTSIISKFGTGFSVNIDKATGEVVIKEGDWLTKIYAALTGDTDPESAVNAFEIKVDDEWVEFGDRDPKQLESGTRVRIKNWPPPASEPTREPEPTPAPKPNLAPPGAFQTDPPDPLFRENPPPAASTADKIGESLKGVPLLEDLTKKPTQKPASFISYRK